MKLLVAALAVAYVVHEAACSYVVLQPYGGSGTTTGITVTVTPQTATIAPGASIPITDTVTGWMHDGSVTWTLSDTTIGTLTVSGSLATYHAPAHIATNPTLVIVTARSNEDTSRKAYCTITISSTSDTSHKMAIQLTPFHVTVQPGQSQQFQATITNATNNGVNWVLASGPGTLSSQGLYVAPSTITGSSATAIVKAIAQADTNVWAEATVTIQMPDTTPCFQSMILPIIVSNCTMSGCHSGSGGEARDLTTYNGILSYVQAGNAYSSRLYRAISSSGGEDGMPPYPRTPLAANQIALIARWINDGAQNTSCNQGTNGCDTTNVQYSSFVSGVIQTYCLGCHSGPSVPSSGNIDLSAYSGVDAVAKDGRLVSAINGSGLYPAMPLGGSLLDSCTVAKIRAWVNAGAPNN